MTAPKRTSFKAYFKILLVVIFPLQAWGLLMVFRDFESMAERTTQWNAVGYAGYTLLMLLIESLFIALVLWGISLLLPKKWGGKRVISVIGTVYTILMGASIVDFAAHAFDQSVICQKYVRGLDACHTLASVLIIETILVVLIASLLVIFKTEKGEKIFAEIFDRISLLSYLYLFLDFAGIIIIILRNVSETL